MTATEEAPLKAPFPYFGGKSKVASVVWNALGNPGHYIEPFFGSGAVLLLRPDYEPKMCETVCDKDGYIANVWRSIQFSCDEVARWCDWPVNHADLSARKRKLIAEEPRLLENLIKDDEWHDPKLAGYWVWAASCWIGSGLTRLGQMPHVSDGGKGVHALGQMPHVSNKGQVCHVSKAGGVYDWLRRISERLRRVRVVCGDWTRVCGGNWQDNVGICGMFFDPPYGVTDRDTSIYHHDSTSVAADVMKWAKERGNNERYRIVLAGYEEYMPLVENCGWTKVTWKARGGYANTSRREGSIAIGKENAKRECLYFSPYCEKAKAESKGLFSGDGK